VNRGGDRRDAEGQKLLFTSRRSSTTSTAQVTMHFKGQSTITLDRDRATVRPGDRATGESYCIAHHLYTEDDERKLVLAFLRYGDTFVKIDGAWLFAERNLYVDWIETRTSHP
jgi:hypothetical protein